MTPDRPEPAPRADRPAPPTADPGPLGFAALALPTFVLSMFTSGLVSAAAEPVVLGPALAYGGIAQVLAGMWAFRRGDVLGATAFTSLGAYWLSFYAFVRFDVPTIPAADVGHAYGLFGVAWAIFTLGLLIASLRTTAAVAAVFLLLTAMLLLLGIGNATATDGLREAGGYAGLLTAAAAWYAALAGVTNATAGRAVLPVRPLGHER